jgi:hypothetical protein
MNRMLWWYRLRNSMDVAPRRAPFWMWMIPRRTRLVLLTGPLMREIEAPARRRRAGPPMVPAPAMLVAACCGATLAYFLDPDTGKRRRKMALDRVGGMFRRSAARTGRLARSAAAEAYGVGQRVVHEAPPRFLRAEPTPDDVTLARTVESEIFRGTDLDKGRVNVSAENGIVVLIGEIDRPDQIEALAAAAGRVPGVKSVDNLLHTPGTPAPSKHHLAGSR